MGGPARRCAGFEARPEVHGLETNESSTGSITRREFQVASTCQRGNGRSFSQRQPDRFWVRPKTPVSTEAEPCD